MTQTNLIQCKGCGEHKLPTQYSKRTASVTGLQSKCKECNKSDNLKFRTAKPEHHADWQKQNMPHVLQYVKKYRKADKTPLIYSITNPLGEVYIGATLMAFKVRMHEHRRHYRRAAAGKRVRLELLHSSFDKWGMDNHKFSVVKELPEATRKELYKLEKAYITINKSNNISLNIK